jgi:hypothetical protein
MSPVRVLNRIPSLADAGSGFCLNKHDAISYVPLATHPRGDIVVGENLDFELGINPTIALFTQLVIFCRIC